MEKEKCKKKTLVIDKEEKAKKNDKKEWKKPTLEDVSGRVMAQPYIRFT
ncbi:MAG: hypothetical protein ACE5JK_00160 [Candidatus Omnitrophota bacterium]